MKIRYIDRLSSQGSVTAAHSPIGTTASQSTSESVTFEIPKSTNRTTTRNVAVNDSSIEAAVYAHIQAVRALGKTTVSVEEIAEALALPRKKVGNIVANLKDKGVRRL